MPRNLKEWLNGVPAHITMLRLPLDKVCKLLFRPRIPSQALQLISTTRSLSSRRTPSHSKEVNSSSKKPVQKDTKKKQPKKVRDEDQALLPSVVLVGRPNVGKSALYNRLVRRKEALVRMKKQHESWEIILRKLSSLNCGNVFLIYLCRRY